MKCQYCGSELSDDAIFCAGCGAAVTASESGEVSDTNLEDNIKFNTASAHMSEGVCSNCGARLRPGNTSCDECGAVIATDGNALEPYTIRDRINAVKEWLLDHKIVIILIIAYLVISIIGSAVSAIITSRRKSANNKTSTTVTTTTSSDEDTATAAPQTATANPTAAVVTPMPTAEPAVITAPVFTTASASSVRGTDTEGGEYSVGSVLTKDPMTKWVPSKSSSNGINEWIQVSATQVQYVSGVEILNGYHKSAEIWRNNNRVKQCTLSFSNGEVREFILDDTMDLIQLDLGETIPTTYIRLTIKSVYSGVKWNDTAITYLGAY